VGSKSVEGEALSNPKEASASLSTWEAQKPTAMARLKGVANWIAEHELWLLTVPVTLMLFFGRLPIRIIGASLLLIPIPWVCRWAAKGYLTAHTPMGLVVVILLGMALVGLYPSVAPEVSKLVLYKMIVEFALFYGLVNSFHSERWIRGTVAVLLLAGAGVSLLGLVGTGGMAHDFSALLGGYRDFLHQLVRRLNESGFNANIVGGTLAMIFPLHLSLLLFDSKALWKLLLGLSLPLVGGTLLLTQSRGAIAGVVLALLVMAIWRSRWVLLSLPVLLTGVLWAVGHFGAQRVAEFLLVTNTTMTAAGRSELWQRAIYMMQDFPYTGIGLGTFSRVMPVLYPTFLIGPDAEVPHAHNLYLQMGVDLGIPGLVAGMALIAAFLLIGISAMRRARRTQLEGIAVGAMGGFVVYLVHGLVDDVTFSTKPAMVLWTLVGLTTAVWLCLIKSTRAS
jgi:putative inorganic carbon (HCO3(-)) transporter